MSEYKGTRLQRMERAYELIPTGKSGKAALIKYVAVNMDISFALAQDYIDVLIYKGKLKFDGSDVLKS